MKIKLRRRKMERKKYLIIAVVVTIATAIAVIATLKLFKSDEIKYEESDKAFARTFTGICEPGKYEIKSLDVYYSEDTGTYYYNIKYKLYVDLNKKWEDIDEVMYGPYGKIHNMYCLSWDDLSGFEDINEEYKETKKNGVHKTYTVDDVEKLIDEAFED